MPASVPLYPSTFNARTPTRPQRRRRNPRLVEVPLGAQPVVRLLFSEMARQRLTYDMAEELSGVRRATAKGWRKKNRPGLESLQAFFSVLGWDFVPIPSLESLPPELAADLVALARRAETTIPNVWREVLNVAIEQRLLNMRSEERAAILAEHDARLARTANDNKPRRKPATKAS